jgi:protein-tyrosine kinase
MNALNSLILPHMADVCTDCFGEDLVVLHDPDGVKSLDLQRLAQTLALRTFNSADETGALSVISAERGEGRSTVAANLACVLSLSGVSVLLIDANLHHPALHSIFGLPQSDGDRGVEFGVPGLENLSLVPATQVRSLGLTSDMYQPLRALIERRRKEFGAIIVDTASAAESLDYQVAALATGAALAVTREGKTSLRKASHMLNSCDDLEINVIGGVMLRR